VLTPAWCPAPGLRGPPASSNPAVRRCASRGSDLGVLSELLPAAEAGLVEALCAGKGER
jgi:hypothetical protein